MTAKANGSHQPCRLIKGNGLKKYLGIYYRSRRLLLTYPEMSSRLDQGDCVCETAREGMIRVSMS